MVRLVGVTVRFVTSPKVTVPVAVPVTAPEAAVIVVVPCETPVRRPPVEMDATLGSELDQQTVFPVQLVPPLKVPVLPSLYVAAAVICVLELMLIVGEGGSIVIVDTVGFWKKPVQLTARARVASAAKAPANRSLFFFCDDILI
jgi:hypothetical protein